MRLNLISGLTEDEFTVGVSPWGADAPFIQHVAKQAVRAFVKFLASQHNHQVKSIEEVTTKSWPVRIMQNAFGAKLADLINYGIIEDNKDGTITFNVETLTHAGEE